MVLVLRCFSSLLSYMHTSLLDEKWLQFQGVFVKLVPSVWVELFSTLCTLPFLYREFLSMVQGILPPHQGYLPPAVLSFLLILSTNFFLLLLIQAAFTTICWARRQDTLPGRFLIVFMEAAFTGIYIVKVTSSSAAATY
jgi:hypothetical protein